MYLHMLKLQRKNPLRQQMKLLLRQLMKLQWRQRKKLLLHKQLHKATTVSHTSPSLEMTMLAPRIPEFAHLRVEKRKGDTSPSLKPDKEKKSKRQKKREAAAERQKSAGGPPKGDVKEEYRDEDGAKGPNGLPRKKGGNPSGGPCKRYNSKAGCGFNFCSFSHE